MPERGRRRFLSTVPGALLALDLPLAHGATIVGVRVWPAKDYTRVTLELDAPLKASHFTVADPPRLVVDLEGVEIDAQLRDLVAKVQANDPYIATVRVGQNRPKVTRLVFDLKAPVAPQVFALPPIAVYRHRLVLDLYPVEPPDPLAQLIGSERDATRGAEAAGSAGASIAPSPEATAASPASTASASASASSPDRPSVASSASASASGEAS